MAIFPERKKAGPQIPEGLWVKCPNCNQIIWKKEIVRNLNTCPKCAYHFRINAEKRFELLFDNQYEELFTELKSGDPLNFKDRRKYPDRLKSAWSQVGLHDAVRVASGTIDEFPVVVCAMEYDFIGGSMGSVVGEKITRAIEYAIQHRHALIIISCSGGARMMEGILSLMQMAKISAALAALDEACLPFISILTDPTTGGVTASYAMLGDVHIAEPGALIGFAGPRVIEQTIRQKLPEGFQRSEFLLEHGFVDIVSQRKDLKTLVIKILRFMWNPEQHREPLLFSSS